MQDQILTTDYIRKLQSDIGSKERKCATCGFVIAGVALVALGLAQLKWRWLHLEGWLPLALIVVAAAAGIGALGFWAACCFVEADLRETYLHRFQWLDEREAADSIFAELPNNDSLIVTRLRRKLSIILPKFICSVCRKPVEPKKAGEVVGCPHCKIQLFVRSSPKCPKCGASASRIISPEEQVAPLEQESKGKAAGALIYGPAGLIAGAVMDGAKGGIRGAIRDSRVSMHHHNFCCTECNAKWAFRLPAARRQPELL